MKEIYSLHDLKNSRIFFDKNPPRFMTWFIGTVLMVIIFLLVWATIAIKVEVVKVKGMVVSQDSTNISPDIQGMVEKVHFTEGDYVQKGDTIVTLKSNSQSAQTETSKDQDEFIEQQLVYYDRYEKSIKTGNNLFKNKSQELEFYNNVQYYIMQNKSSDEQISTYQQQIKEQENNKNQANKNVQENKDGIKEINTTVNTISLEISKLQDEVSKIDLIIQPEREDDVKEKQEILDTKQSEMETLNNKKNTLEAKIIEEESNVNTSKEQIEQLQDQVQSAKGSKDNLKIQILAQIGQKRSELKLQSIESKGKYTANSEYESNYTLNAVSDGILHFNYDIKEGTVVQAATPIAKVMNDDDNVLSLQVALPSNERSKVQQEDPVEIALDGILQTKFGVIEGKIIEINIDSSVDQESGEAYFLTYIEPKDNQLKDKNENTVLLKPGMTSEIRIKYEQNTWMQWLLEQINIFI
ncbi:HlyD family efflux transporter periplasmic adaptor subunit [Alkalibaculum sp. M08DMB]|uniref:HlyD family efflux transporter periplasmic adaptor subunit n=1 Tax=Alkalibaculum sporogenes TaxID=2655001 RepID=A0A6A7KCY9_9FIRM|nr:HlyD family efflux transporter periplasmic adaptor subunit [Alkalibaculum sporogenes]MPW27324.1 HlyD family efflux transporter periplasmic adaptor subunit [Alkalibaculum sporogenes]